MKVSMEQLFELTYLHYDFISHGQL